MIVSGSMTVMKAHRHVAYFVHVVSLFCNAMPADKLVTYSFGTAHLRLPAFL